MGFSSSKGVTPSRVCELKSDGKRVIAEIVSHTLTGV